MSDPTPSTSAPSAPSRLLSLDALRGFDMFWIIGAEDIVHALRKVSQRGPINFLSDQLQHKPWEGLAFYDLIFPLFIYIVGVSLVFSLSRSLRTAGRAATVRRILKRSVLLLLIGVAYYGGLNQGVEGIRLMGVLQRIALCYLFASLIFCFAKLRGMIAICAALLVGYWMLLTFVPVPGHGAGSFAEGANLANYLDSRYLPLRKWDGDHDPEGLLSTLPAIATCLLGVFSGLLLSNPRIPQRKKVLTLIAGGIAGVFLGFIWGLQFPVIKKIWTSSYVLVAGGYSCLFLAVFYQVIEVWQRRRWAAPFVWIGMNPITIYLASEVVDFRALAERIAGGPIKGFLGSYGDLLITSLALGLSFLLVRFLYQRKIFLRL
jgi:predicted acyltransferase